MKLIFTSSIFIYVFGYIRGLINNCYFWMDNFFFLPQSWLHLNLAAYTAGRIILNISPPIWHIHHFGVVMSPWSVIFFSRDRGEKKCVCVCICEKAEDGEHMSWTIYPRRSKRLHFLMKIEEKNRYAFHTSTLKAEKAHQSALISERLTCLIVSFSEWAF